MVTMVSIFIVTFMAWADQSALAQVLTFNQWKSQQIADSKNRVVRLSNQLTLLKTTPGTDSLEHRRLEGELRTAQQGVDAVLGLSFEDYLTVYLSQFANDQRALSEVIKGLKSEEILKLLQASLRQVVSS